MALLGGPSTITNGLVVALDAGNSLSYPGSGTSWYDVSGNNYTGTLYNTPSYSSGYITFDGTNDFAIPGGAANLYAWTANGSVGTGFITCETWVRTSDESGYILSKPWNGSGRYNMLINAGSFYVVVGTGTPGGNDQSYQINYPSTIATGTWKHLVVWANPNQIGYYINGNQYSGSASHGLTGGASDQGNSGLPLTIMTLYPYGEGWGGNTGFSVAGDVGLVRTYSRQLTASEVLQNYNATKGRFGL